MRLIAIVLGLLLSAAPVVAADFRILPHSPLATGCPFDHLGGLGLTDGLAPGFALQGIPPCPYSSIGPGVTLDAQGNRLVHSRMNEVFQHFFLDSDRTPGIYTDGAFNNLAVLQRALAETLIRAPVIRMSGQIAPGDAARLDALLREQNAAPCLAEGLCPFSSVLALESPGGSLEAALELARLVRRYQIITYIPAEATCASSCAFVFFAGYSDYEGVFHPRRIVHAGSRLGLHRPVVPLTAGSYADQQVEQIIDLIDTVKAEAVRQFSAARVPLHFLEQMYATSPDGMAYLSTADLSLFATILDGPWPTGARPTRAGILAFCAAEHQRVTGNRHPDLLITLELRDASFLAYDRQGYFACYGARDVNAAWRADICGPGQMAGYPDYQSACALIQCMNQNQPLDAICSDTSMAGSFMGWTNERSLGEAIRSLPSARLHDILRQLAATDRWGRSGLSPLPAWTVSAPAPNFDCGRIDLRAPTTAVALQAALNARGFAAGFPDGAIGPQTEAALAVARRRLAPGRRFDDPAFLRALGLTETQIREATLCD